MEGGRFGRNAGPRGSHRGPVPVFGSQEIRGRNRNRKPLRRADVNVSYESAHAAPKRSNVWERLGPLNETQSPIHTARSHRPSDADVNYQRVSKKSRPHSRKSDFMPGAPSHSHLNTRRKQFAYNDFILDDARVQPSRGNQHSKENHFPSPTVPPRRHVLPQNSHRRGVATQKSDKLTERKPQPSTSPSSQILAQRDEEAKEIRLARFGAELSQPVVEMVEPPVSNVESSKQQADVDFPKATAIIDLCPDMCPGKIVVLGNAVLAKGKKKPRRVKRQRKDDLHKHELLDGDKNVTTKFLAVKKGEDTENVAEHHDVLLKNFKEMYIEKKDPFLLQGDPLKRSLGAGKKGSLEIKLDLCSNPVLTASLEDISCLLKVFGTKRVSPKKPDTEISDSAKLIKVSDQAQSEFQHRGESHEDVPVKTERHSGVPDIPLSHLPPPSNNTNFQPILLASNAHRQDEAEIYPVDKSEEKMKIFRDKMKPIFSEVRRRGKMYRRWRQRTKEIRLQREKKERKEALVREALESLSVGPLLRTSAYKAPRKEMLNIDRAIRARHAKQVKSWSVLNTSELVTPILAEQNPNARCLCWKLLLSLPADPMDTLPIKWLVTKFNLHEVGSFVSISKTWSDPLLSLSFIRADKTGPFEKRSVAGASSILFLLSGDAPLETHKARLHNLCSHIPANSNLPLLIAIGDRLNGEETAIIAKLDLADIEQTKLKGISVIYLNQSLQNELGSNELLDDGRLREGVRWLAEHSPPQSGVSLVDTRAIVLSYLKLKLEVLGDACEVGPDQCIAAVNKSIDWLIRAILVSASANSNLWPCPEIDLLQKYSGERNYAEMTLPRTSWSEPQKVQGQIDVLNACKLPCFGSDLSWLCQGSHYTVKKHVQDQKQGLEEFLFNYVNLYTGCHEAMDESRKLVQRCTSIVLRDSCFYLVPRWTAIFRRILDLRLITIPKDASDVYVCEDIANVQSFIVGWNDLLVSEELPLVPLDEMIEKCFIAGFNV